MDQKGVRETAMRRAEVAVAAGERPLHGCAQVVVVALEGGQQLWQWPPVEERAAPLCRLQEVRRVTVAHHLGLGRVDQPPGNEIVDRLQEPVATVLSVEGDEASVNQLGEEGQDIARLERRITADVLCTLDGKAAREHRQAAQQHLLELLKQLVAPLHRGLQRLLPRQRGAHSAGEQAEAVGETLVDVSRTQIPYPRGGLLDGKGEPVEARTHLGNDVDALVVESETWQGADGPVDEQP